MIINEAFYQQSSSQSFQKLPEVLMSEEPKSERMGMGEEAWEEGCDWDDRAPLWIIADPT